MRKLYKAIWLVMAVVHTAALSNGQTASPSSAANPVAPQVFKANARIVVLDVVVTNRSHQTVKGLRQQDFRVAEDGQPQTVRSFEEHTGAQPLNVNPAPVAPDVFTNIPQVQPSDALTVLLLDSLNTPLTDQGRVHAQVLKYLKKPQPGGRVAIFLLGSRLRMIQGFTDDPALLTAALNDAKKGSGQHASPLLQTDAEKGADQEVVSALAEQSAELAAAMQQFLSEQIATRNDLRVQLTLDALQQIAQYLTGIPGRKNLVWFSGAFPVAILPDPDLTRAFAVQNTHQDAVKKTDALLASAQVAVYPIAAEGVATDSIYSAGAETRLATKTQLARPQQEAQERNTDHATMDEIAKNTGGAAFYNTNGLSNALERATEHGTYFYTLTYTSTNPALDGRYRRIEVRLASGGGNQLAYRQGYYADDTKTAAVVAATVAATPAPKSPQDKLTPYLRPGLPISTQVPLTLRVVRGMASTAGPSAARSSNQGGDNPNLKGPVVRYSVDFLVPARGLRFAEDAAGTHHVNLESALVVCNRQGQPVNWMLRQVNLNLDAKRYQAAQSTGINLFLEIDAPGDAVTLLSGVYDLNANQVGTLELRLSRVVDPHTTASAH